MWYLPFGGRPDVNTRKLPCMLCGNLAYIAGMIKRPSDAVIKEYDHAMDDIRYFAATVLALEFRWVPWREGA